MRAKMEIIAHVPLTTLSEALTVDEAHALDETLKSMISQGTVRLTRIQIRKADSATFIFTSPPTE